MSHITVEIDADKVAVLTISNTAKLNAWTESMRASFAAEFKNVSSQHADECRAIVITGAGGNFCAGQDLGEVISWDGERAASWVRSFRSFYDLPRKSPKPVIAAINGVCAGSALQFALCTDYRVGCPTMRIGQPEIRSGQASVTGSGLLRLAVGGAAMRSLVLTARMVSGDEALRIGLVDELADEAAVLARAREVALDMASLPPTAFAESKRAMAALEDAELDRAFEEAVRTHTTVYEAGESSVTASRFLGRARHGGAGVDG